MTTYLIGTVQLLNGEVDRVAMADTDATKSLVARHVTASIEDLVQLLDAGHTLAAHWVQLPTEDGSNTGRGTIPLELVTLIDGRRSVEIVQRDQPEGYRRLKDLPQCDPAMVVPGLWQPLRSPVA